MFRLTRGNRYIIAIENDGELEPYPYWDEAQALVAKNIPADQWAAVVVEVYKQVFSDRLPIGFLAFMRQDRRAVCRGVVLWHGAKLYPFRFPTLEAAVSAARHDDASADWQQSQLVY